MKIEKPLFNKRAFLNGKDSAYSGMVHCFAGKDYGMQGQIIDFYMMRLGSCHDICTIHAPDKKKMVKKMKILQNVINEFILKLEEKV